MLGLSDRIKILILILIHVLKPIWQEFVVMIEWYVYGPK